MNPEFQVHVVPKEKEQLFLSCLAFCLAILGSFFLFLLLIRPSLLLILAAALIAISWIARTAQPYFRLRRQFLQPDRLLISEGDLLFFTNKRKTLQIPLSSIERVSYREGIAIYLRKANYIVLDPQFPIGKWLKKGRLKGCDLLFEHFDPSVQARLQDIVQMKKAYHSRLFQDR